MIFCCLRLTLRNSVSSCSNPEIFHGIFLFSIKVNFKKSGTSYQNAMNTDLPSKKCCNLMNFVQEGEKRVTRSQQLQVTLPSRRLDSRLLFLVESDSPERLSSLPVYSLYLYTLQEFDYFVVDVAVYSL